MGGMGEKEIVIMYHYIEDKVFLKDMKYLCSNIINQLVQLINNDSVTGKQEKHTEFIRTCL